MIVEYGFLDTVNDANRLKNNWQEYAEAVVGAIASYAGYNYDYQGDNIYYTVKLGDTLYSIAKKYNISVDKLKDINNLTSNALAIGQKLLISGTPDNINEEIYIVKSGDTLYSIARKFDLTLNELMKLNNLTSNTLSIGQRLKISSNQASNKSFYIVKSGDTLYSLAKKFNISVEELKKINNLSTNTLSINQVLKVPEVSEYNTYIVKSGDTLYGIARKYNISVDKLKDINNLKSDALNLKQELKVPK